MTGQPADFSSRPDPLELERVRTDKRYLPRWDVDRRVICTIGRNERAFECRTMDISCSGLCLVMSHELPEYDRLKIRVYLDDDAPLELNGQMRWHRDSAYGHLIGVHFEDADDGVHQLILAHAFESKGVTPHEHWFGGWGPGDEPPSGCHRSSRKV